MRTTGRPEITEEGHCAAAHCFGLDGIRWLIASQPGHFSIQSCDNRGQPLHPLCGEFAKEGFGILVPKEAFGQRPVEVLHDTLVPVDVSPTAPSLNRVLPQQLTDTAHELMAGVNLKELRPPLVKSSKAIGDLCLSLASQGLSLFVAVGDVNDRESVTEDFRPRGQQYALVGFRPESGET